MHILYVIGKLDVGGAELHLLNITKKLSAKGVNIKIFPLKRGGVLESQFIDNGVQIIGNDYTGLGKIGVVFSAFELVIRLYSCKLNIIHFFLPEAYMIGAMCSFFTPKLIRVMSRRSLSMYQDKLFFTRKVEEFLHKRMTMILGNSKAVCNELRNEGVPESKLKLIYNGVDVEKQSDADNIKFISKGSERIILCIANLIPYKGHEDILYGLKSIRNDIGNEWSVLFAGRNDGCGKKLMELSQQLGIESNVKFLGSVGDVAGLIEQSDIGLLCSHQEGFSNSILECMAGGLPMVVTNVGGNSEAIIDGVTGFIVEPMCPFEIGQAILKLFNDSLLRKEMGAAAKMRVYEQFTMDKCVEEYNNLYINLIQAEKYDSD